MNQFAARITEEAIAFVPVLIVAACWGVVLAMAAIMSVFFLTKRLVCHESLCHSRNFARSRDHNFCDVGRVDQQRKEPVNNPATHVGKEKGCGECDYRN